MATWYRGPQNFGRQYCIQQTYLGNQLALGLVDALTGELFGYTPYDDPYWSNQWLWYGNGGSRWNRWNYRRRNLGWFRWW